MPPSKTASTFSSRERFGIQFVELARRWRRALDHSLAQTGLTDASWSPLVRLHELGDGVQQKELALRLGLSEPSLVRLLDLLERRGLIQRRTDKSDRRAKLIYLTAEGQAAVRDIRKALVSVEADLLAELSDQDLDLMQHAFDRIGQRIDTVLANKVSDV